MKCCKVKFKGGHLMIGTDGTTLRIRTAGLNPIEVTMTDCRGSDKVPTVELEKDVLFLDPSEKKVKAFQQHLEDLRRRMKKG